MRFAPSLLLSCALLAPSAVADVQDTFDYFVNNWNVVGLPDYFHGSRITPNNELYLDGGTAVRIRVGHTLTPLSRAQGKRALHGWMPIIEVTAMDGAVRYQIAFWVTPRPDAKDWQKAFRWPTEGENYLNWISVQATNTSTEVLGQKPMFVRMSPGTRTSWRPLRAPGNTPASIPGHGNSRLANRPKASRVIPSFP